MDGTNGSGIGEGNVVPPTDGGGGGGGGGGPSPASVDMLCRVLRAIDSDVVSLEIPRTQDQACKSMAFKDAMRESAVSDMTMVMYELIVLFRRTQPSSAARVLETLGLYVNWMEISLIANAPFVELLFDISQDETAEVGLRGASLDVIQEVLLKRMEPAAKLQMLATLGVVGRIKEWAGRMGLVPGAISASSSSPTKRPPPEEQRLEEGMMVLTGHHNRDEDRGEEGQEEEEEELYGKVGTLLGTLASEVLGAWKSIENSLNGFTAVLGLREDDPVALEAQEACTAAEQMVNGFFPVLLAAVRSPRDDMMLPTLPFFSTWVLRLKRIADGQARTVRQQLQEQQQQQQQQQQQGGAQRLPELNLEEMEAHLLAVSDGVVGEQLGLLMEAVGYRAGIPRNLLAKLTAEAAAADEVEEEEEEGEGRGRGTLDGEASLLVEGEDGEELGDRRRELFSLFKNMVRLAPIMATRFVCQVLCQTIPEVAHHLQRAQNYQPQQAAPALEVSSSSSGSRVHLCTHVYICRVVAVRIWSGVACCLSPSRPRHFRSSS